MAILEKVLYEIFESDAESLDDHPDLHVHEIDREIHLMFGGETPDVFVSWQQSDAFSRIASGQTSFFSPPPAVVRDLSVSPMWAHLIGKPVSIQHVDADQQVLRITDGQHEVFCCSREGERWGADVVQVTKEKPIVG